MSVYAHTLLGRPEQEWELLVDHLQRVAHGDAHFPGAAGFAAAFDAREWGRLAGLWHDLGKYSGAFQQLLRDSAANRPLARVDHSTAGAVHAERTLPGGPGRLLAFVIAGHHAGLPDRGTSEGDESCLLWRLGELNRERRPEIDAALRTAQAHITEQVAPVLPACMGGSLADSPLRLAMFIRMLFSCLVDADRLATEAFQLQGRAPVRGSEVGIPRLRAALDQHLAVLAPARVELTPVNRVRQELLAACRAAAEKPPGLFSLTAPTGSGKTLSSMAFALRHAEQHGMRRVIYALPFTSVTEQNAGVFKGAFQGEGARIVLEHHSAYHTQHEDEGSQKEVWRRLAAENWDAPVVVTTNVQLLESLFASGPSPCRKLHRIARSVVILDEAQSLPVDLLRPTLAALQELTAYGTSVVLCSATMPAVNKRDDFPIGLSHVREIVPDPAGMAAALRRAQVRTVGKLTDEQLADRIAGTRQCLAIVNTRTHAARLFQLSRGLAEDVLHLSALMCPAHRSERVGEIKLRLKDKRPCRVVSTQVVEAGVDIDFPLVLRAMAGLDSIVQAAGRCNREGLGPLGEVLVFETEEKPPKGIVAAIDATRQVLGPGVDALDLKTIETFFSLHYWQRGDPAPRWDGSVGSDGRRVGITEMLGTRHLAFRTAAEHYKLIDEYAVPIVVPYGQTGRELRDRLLAAKKPEPALWRQAQQYTVSVPPKGRDFLFEGGFATMLDVGLVVLTDESLYDPVLGLRLDGQVDPTIRIV